MKGKLRLLLLFFMITISSLLELLSVSLIVPVINIIIDPAYQLFDMKIINNFLTKENLILLIILVVVGSYISRFLILFWQIKFSNEIGNFFVKKLLEGTFKISYIKFLEVGSSNITTTIQNRVSSLVNETLIPFVSIIQAVVTVSVIFVGLAYINFFVSIWLVSLILACYILIFVISRKKIKKIGQSININTTKLLQNLKEILLIFREIKLYQVETKFSSNYSDRDLYNRRQNGYKEILGFLPKFFVEPILFIALIGLVYLMSIPNFSKTLTVGELIAIIFGLQKCFPMLQNSYSSITNIRAGYPQLKQLVAFASLKSSNVASHIIEQNKDYILRADNINYAFHNGKTILKNVTFQCGMGEKICVVGESGSGKSTLLNMIMGIIQPNSGSIRSFNNHPESGNSSEISFVSQHPVLVEGTVLENILLFEKNSEKLDWSRLKKCYLAACLDLVFKDFEQGIHAKVIEEGGNLSGGQKQRISISRCLYRNASLVLLDEATSALDKNTSKLFLKRIKDLYPDSAFICISHNSDVIKSFDKVLELKDGNLNVIT